MRLFAEFRLSILARTLPPGSGRVPGLGHEAFDDTVEDNAIVKFLVHKLLYPGDVVGREIRPKLDHDTALGCFQDQCIFFILEMPCLTLSLRRLKGNF